METKDTMSEEANRTMFEWIKKQIAEKAKDKAREAVEIMKTQLVTKWREDNKLREDFSENFGAYEAFSRNNGGRKRFR